MPEINDSYLELLAAVGFSNLKVTELKSNIIKVHTKKQKKIVLCITVCGEFDFMDLEKI